MERNDETVFHWDPRLVKDDTLWMTYMIFANTSSVVVYGEPMLDVQFLSASNDTRCSSGAANVELAIIEVSTPTH